MSAGDERNDEFEGFEIASPGGAGRWVVLAIAIAAIGALAAIPKVLGLGWFGARLIAEDDLVVWVYNNTMTELTVEVPLDAPKRVPAASLHDLTTLTGDVWIEARGPDGEVLERVETHVDSASSLFYSALGADCLAVIDLTAFYGRGDDEITVADRIWQDDRLYEVRADTLVLPHRVAPDQAAGTVHWIMRTGCQLLDPAEEDVLLAQATVRLRARRDARREALEQRR